MTYFAFSSNLTLSKEAYMEDELYTFLKKLDRSFFIDTEHRIYASYDTPLPIGLGQTISQPSLVHEMTEFLELNKGLKVLEIGTGSGYQTVILAEFAGLVYTVERHEELSKKAQKKLEELGYSNISFKVGDGSYGWEEYSPYDRIIVTAAPGEIPRSLIEQLAPNGFMIIPVGEKGYQHLTLVMKDSQNRVTTENLGDVTFVELVGEHGWSQ
jgi:protein-L-isoaspartate(D-aspartate) O-methyltransferase